MARNKAKAKRKALRRPALPVEPSLTTRISQTASYVFHAAVARIVQFLNFLEYHWKRFVIHASTDGSRLIYILYIVYTLRFWGECLLLGLMLQCAGPLQTYRTLVRAGKEVAIVLGFISFVGLTIHILSWCVVDVPSPWAEAVVISGIAIGSYMQDFRMWYCTPTHKPLYRYWRIKLFVALTWVIPAVSFWFYLLYSLLEAKFAHDDKELRKFQARYGNNWRLQWDARGKPDPGMAEYMESGDRALAALGIVVSMLFSIVGFLVAMKGDTKPEVLVPLVVWPGHKLNWDRTSATEEGCRALRLALEEQAATLGGSHFIITRMVTNADDSSRGGAQRGSGRGGHGGRGRGKRRGNRNRN